MLGADGERKDELICGAYGPQHIDTPMLADLQKLIFINVVRAVDVVYRTCQ